jgi:RNA 3'-terminal phosphate cyclase (ATP)
MIELDGSVGEGGGQILRSALALSLCTGQPLRIQHIRAKRPKPGLMRQHRTCVLAAAAVCGAQVQGDELGSQTLVFTPGAVQAGDYAFSVGTAGSCTLVLQTVLPALMRTNAPSHITLGGGTHNAMAPPFHCLERSFAPLLRRLGVGLDLELRRHGFYPAGGGEMLASITPSALQPFDLLERGPLRDSFAECLIPALPRSVATRELAVLGQALGWAEPQLRTPVVRQNVGPGNALMAMLEYASVCEVLTSFGDKSVSAEQVAQRLVKQVHAYQASDGALGEHMADQWMLPLALAVADTGVAARYTCTRLTAHARTNIGVIEAFLNLRFSTEKQGAGWLVEVVSRG